VANTGIVKRVALVSFNANERHAVDLLLSDIASGAPSPWARDGELQIRRAVDDGEWRLQHVPLQAQGNIVAGAQLAAFFADHQQRPDYIIFYGCAGALRAEDVASVFLVEFANYLSLGTVQRSTSNEERVTVKNKWLCDLYPQGDVEPLAAVPFPLALPGQSALDVRSLSGIPGARVIATDKVVRVRPGQTPLPVMPGPPRDLYAKDEWTYGQALGLWAGSGEPVLVEMESYGIGRIAQALQIHERVVVVRVTTDTLADHADSDDDQRRLLERARPLLGRVVAILLDPGATP
jgi:hypothetical protein